MSKIEALKDLNDISRGGTCGVFKQWIYKGSDNNKVGDLMQKINFYIQDLNKELEIIDKVEIKDVVYIISLVDWLKEAYDEIEKCIGKTYLENFHFSKSIELENAKEYFVAIRSFIVAHPSSTNRHGKFGFDGDFICTDIIVKLNPILGFMHDDTYYTISINGIENKRMECDFYLHSYSKKADKMQFMKFIGCNFIDIYNVARLYIDKLYELDKYLIKNIKRKDYE